MEGEFDKIASIGMFEQVGIVNYPTYFRSVHRLLRPRGLYLHHTIARRAKRSERAFRKVKPEYRALTRYIFPGGELDHLGMSIVQPRALRLRDPRRRGLARALPAHHPAVVGEPQRPPRRGGSGGRPGEDPDVAPLPRGLLACLRARLRRHQPDPRLEARPRSGGTAVDPSGSLRVRCAALLPLAGRSWRWGCECYDRP